MDSSGRAPAGRGVHGRCPGRAGDPATLSAPAPAAQSTEDNAVLGEATTIATGLEVPWAVAFLPDGAALVSERDSGRVLRVEPDGAVTEVGIVPGVVSEGEGGLLGLAVSPDFSEDSLVYAYLTTESDNRIIRMPYDPDNGLGAVEVVVDSIPKADRHNGGQIAFGPDGMLYAGTGDAGRAELAQDTDSLAGKILRMTPTALLPRTLPSTTLCTATGTAMCKDWPGMPTAPCTPPSLGRILSTR